MRKSRLIALAISGSLLATITTTGTSTAYAIFASKTPKPTKAQIDAAKAAEAAKAAAANAAASKLNSAKLTLRQLAAASDAATAKFRVAQQNLSVAMQDKRNTRIRVSYQAFDMVPARYAQALVVWQLVFAGTDKSLTCYSRLHQTVKPGVAELVLAQQKNVQQLAEQIAQAVLTRAQPTGIVCQAK